MNPRERNRRPAARTLPTRARRRRATLIDALEARTLLAGAPVTLLSQTFDAVPLAPSQELVFTHTPPAGWALDNAGMPVGGVEEWRGWSFADRDWWVAVAGDQERSQFTKGTGVVVVADPDEWDDRAHDPGTFNSFLSTPAIPIASAAADSLSVTFDSSWRQELPQKASLVATFDVGDPVTLFVWDTRPDATNETVTLPIAHPAGATTMTLAFGMTEAGNNWWWAIDNVRVKAGDATLLDEDFEDRRADFGPQVHETAFAVSDVAPAGWTFDDTGLPAGGVADWAGWTVARKDYWLRTTAGGPTGPRSQFVGGSNAIAVADAGAWNAEPRDPGTYQSLFVSPSIAVDRINGDSGVLTFNSSWIPAGNQTAIVTVSYDGGAPFEVLHWGSDPGLPGYKAAAPDEVVSVPLHNPTGALTAVVSFQVLGDTGAAGDYWWAIDNVQVAGTAGVVSLLSQNFDELASTSPAVDEANPFINVFSGFGPVDWTLTNDVDLSSGLIDWAGWVYARPEWWGSLGLDGARGGFSKGSGVIAIADPARWNGTGTFNLAASTPSIALAAATGGAATLQFDSSWLPAGSQQVIVEAAYNVGGTAELLRWTAAGAGRKPEALDETVSVDLAIPAGATSVVLTFRLANGAGGGFWAYDDIALTSGAVTLYQQGFDGLIGNLTPPIEEVNPLARPWSPTPPDGWSIVDTIPSGGVTEWRGFSLANRYFWAEAGLDGGREQFARARNFVAVADPDAWADLGVGTGTFNALLQVPEISLNGVIAGTAFLKFDSSWRPGSGQTAIVRVRYDGGPAVDLLRWSSNPADADYKPDALDETVSVLLANPLGAGSMALEFAIAGADGSSQFWAIDNVEILAQALQSTILSENFDSIPLGPSPVERGSPPVFTHVAPEGWVLDNTGVPTGGIPEWEGWSFVDKVFWTIVGQSGGNQFTKGRGIIAVADSDEYDDVTIKPDYASTGGYNTLLTTPVIAVGAAPSVTLRFDSSWRPESNQTATLVALFATPGGNVQQVLFTWESVSSSPNFKPDSRNETVIVAMDVPAGATGVTFTFAYTDARNNWWWAIDNISVTDGTDTLFAEDFESHKLTQAPTGETFNTLWTPNAPTGWAVDNTGVPTGGVTEWQGWTFPWKRFWTTVAQTDAGAAAFTKGTGIIAVADSDEYDDVTNKPDYASTGGFNTFLTTPSLPLASATTASFKFDSSWRPEDTQTATLRAIFSTPGGDVEVVAFLWESDSASPNYKPDAVNETVTVDVPVPAGATAVVWTLGYTKARNNWWWAIDNVEASVDGTVVLLETFDRLALQAPVVEVNPFQNSINFPQVWSKEGPEGWTVDDSQFQDGGPNDPKGVLDWRGWSFANGPYADTPFWGVQTDDQDRRQFTKSRNVVAVVDPDEYDDAPHGGGSQWLYNSFLKTPDLDVSQVGAGTAFLTFDSSWRPEGFDDGNPADNNQTAVITVSFDGGAPIEILRWDSNQNGAFYKPDATNETVRVALNNPAGAGTMQISFGLVQARNDWWWAIDNLLITGVIASFQAIKVTPTESGVEIDFNKAIDPSTLDLYGGANPDVTLVGAQTGPVAGTLVIAPDGSKATFIKSGGVLADDTYTLTLRSAADGFRDLNAALLDGDANGQPGGDFVQQFTVKAAGPVVAIGDVVRGAGQAVNLPANGAGLPLTVSEGLGVSSIQVDLRFDPSLLAVTGATLDPSMPAGSTLDFTLVEPGLARFIFNSPTPLGAGAATIGSIQSSVPADALYGHKGVLKLAGLAVNGSTAIGSVDSGVHVAAFIGDANADGQYTAGDYTLLRRFVVGLNSSFALYPNVDPTLIGDINGDGQFTTGDATQIRRFVVGLTTPLLPELPAAPPTIPADQDPLVWIPTDLVALAGEAFAAPIRFVQTDPAAVLLRGFEIVVGYDPALIEVLGVEAGSLTAGFEVSARVDASQGLIFITGVSPDETGVSIATGTTGTLAVLRLRAADDARGSTPLNLRADGSTGNQTIRTALNGGRLLLIPAPSNGSDPLDGLVRFGLAGGEGAGSADRPEVEAPALKLAPVRPVAPVAEAFAAPVATAPAPAFVPTPVDAVAVAPPVTLPPAAVEPSDIGAEPAAEPGLAEALAALDAAIASGEGLGSGSPAVRRLLRELSLGEFALIPVEPHDAAIASLIEQPLGQGRRRKSASLFR